MKNSRKSHYTDVVRTFKSNEQTVCHLLMSFIYVSYTLSVPPVPTTNQKWGGTCPSVPHGVGAYGRISVCPTVYPYVCLIIWQPHAAVANLLLWARRAGDIDRWLHGQRSAATASSITLSAGVGSWTVTCLLILLFFIGRTRWSSAVVDYCWCGKMHCKFLHNKFILITVS